MVLQRRDLFLFLGLPGGIVGGHSFFRGDLWVNHTNVLNELEMNFLVWRLGTWH